MVLWAPVALAQGSAFWETAQYQNVAQTQSEAAQLRGVNFLSLAGRSQIFLRLDRSVPYRQGRLSNPPRVFFDLEQTVVGEGVPSTLSVVDGLVREVRISQFRAQVVRVVIDLARPELETAVAAEPPQMLIEVLSPVAGARPQAAGESSSPPAGREEGEAPEPAGRSEIGPEPAPERRPEPAPPEPVPPAPNESPEEARPAAAAATSVSTPPARVYAVSVDSALDRTQIFVGVQRSVPFTRGRLENPERIYFDLRNTQLDRSIRRQLAVRDGRVLQVRLGQFTRRTTRVVVEVEPDAVHRVEFQRSPPGLLIEILHPGDEGPPLPSRVAEAPPQIEGPPEVMEVEPEPSAPAPEAAEAVEERVQEEPLPEEEASEILQAKEEKAPDGAEETTTPEAQRVPPGPPSQPQVIRGTIPSHRPGEEITEPQSAAQRRREEPVIVKGTIPALRPGEEPGLPDESPRVLTGRIPTRRPGEAPPPVEPEEEAGQAGYEQGELQVGELEERWENAPSQIEQGPDFREALRATPADVEIPRVTRAPEIEDFLQGRPREAEAVITEFRQRSPGDGIPATEETRAFLSYDDDHLYAVFVCDDRSGDIRAQVSKREQTANDDQVFLYLDTFFDQSRAFLFSVNPYGIQRDGIRTEGQGSDFKFDTLWYSEGRITDHGYVVWMKIPFKSLRFPSADAQTWGIALGRFIRRRQESSFWPYITRRIDGFVPQLATLRGLGDISPGRNIEVVPYSTYTNSRNLTGQPAGGLGYRSEDEFDGGVDVKTVFRDSITLDLTANPDFSQVESDEPQVTINRRFEVFFPEKRPFFIENADFFQTPERLFFSRRIADPQFGARLTGRVGDWRIGLLTMDDEAPGKRVSATHSNSGKRAANAVLRFQRDFGDQSNVGILYTSRDFANTSNRVFGLDTRLQIDPNWFFSGQIAGSETRNSGGSKLADPLYLAQLTHSGTHAQFFARYLDRAPEFRSQLGFIQRVDIRQVDSTYQYLWYPEDSIVLDFGPSVSALANWDHQGRLQDWYVNGGFQLDLLGPTTLQVNRYESMTLYEGIEFRQGRTDLSFYRGFNWIDFFLSYGRGGGINFNPAAGLSPFLAEAQDASAFVGIRPSSRLSIDATYIFSALQTRENAFPTNSPETVTIFNNHLVRWRANYQFNRELSLRAILDYNSIIPNPDLIFLDRDKFLTFDILLTYLLNPGTALYAGYTNRYWNIALDPAQPFGYSRTAFPETTTSRQFFVKISRLFRY